jgi:hypothetical protein
MTTRFIIPLEREARALSEVGRGLQEGPLIASDVDVETTCKEVTLTLESRELSRGVIAGEPTRGGKIEREVTPADTTAREISLADEEIRAVLVTGTARVRLIVLDWNVAQVDSLIVPVGTETVPRNAELKASPTMTETSATLLAWVSQLQDQNALLDIQRNSTN